MKFLGGTILEHKVCQWKRALAAQCCNPKSGTLLFRWIWSTGCGLKHSTRKATARYLCIRPTTQPLHQGAGKAGITRPEELCAKWSTKSRYWSARLQVQSPRGRFAFHVFNPAIMIVSKQCAYSGCNHLQCGRLI